MATWANAPPAGAGASAAARRARPRPAPLPAADLSPFRVITLPLPDINIVCYLLCHPSLTTLGAVNEFNERVYARLSLARADPAPEHIGPRTPSRGAARLVRARSDQAPEYIVTRTRLRSPAYDGAIGPILDSLGVASLEEWKTSGTDGLVVLRSTGMDPLLAAAAPASPP